MADMQGIIDRIRGAQGAMPPMTPEEELLEARARVRELEEQASFRQFAQEQATGAELSGAFRRREGERAESAQLQEAFQRREGERAEAAQLTGAFGRREGERVTTRELVDAFLQRKAQRARTPAEDEAGRFVPRPRDPNG